MGRNCGKLVVNACLASRDVNICLVPEFQFQLYGADGVFEAIIDRCKRKNHCVIVIAEGAFAGLIDSDKAKVLDTLFSEKPQMLSTEWESPTE